MTQTQEDVAKIEAYRKTLGKYPKPSVTADIVAVRPAYSVLNKAKIRREFVLTIPHWMDGLKRCIAKLNEQA